MHTIKLYYHSIIHIIIYIYIFSPREIWESGAAENFSF